MPLCLVLLCLSEDRELNLICSVLSPTLSVCIKTFWTYPWVCLYKIMLCSRAVVPKWRDTQEEGCRAGQQHWNMKEIVDIYCFMSHSELWTQGREFLVAHLQSDVVQTSRSLITLNMNGWIRDGTVPIKWHGTIFRNVIFVVVWNVITPGDILVIIWTLNENIILWFWHLIFIFYLTAKLNTVLLPWKTHCCCYFYEPFSNKTVHHHICTKTTELVKGRLHWFFF